MTIPVYSSIAPYNGDVGPTEVTSYKYDVDWDNDGEFDETGVTGSATHKYDEPGTYTIRIRGKFPAFYLETERDVTDGIIHDYPSGDNYKLLRVDQWGTQKWTRLKFSNCINFNITATDIPDLEKVFDMSEMFDRASSFNSPIGHWDVSSIKDMSAMFKQTPFNQPLGDWDVSQVIDMSFMFWGATDFNQPLENWNVGNVSEMLGVFRSATSFNQPLENWDVSNVINMNQMFSGATSFNQSLGEWNVSHVSSMDYFLNGANSFSTENYDHLLIGWAKRTLPSGVTLDVNTEYCSDAATTARNKMINTYNWTIQDLGRCE